MILSFLRCNDDGPLFLECSSFFLRGFGTSGTNIGKPTLAIKEQHDTADEEQDEKKECAIKERIDDADTDVRTMDMNGTDERQDATTTRRTMIPLLIKSVLRPCLVF